MVSAMMKVTLLSATMMVVTVVLLDFFLLRLEMAIAMIIQILLSVAMMEETAVDHASTLITAQIVLVLEI
jgi:hypothetical protein